MRTKEINKLENDLQMFTGTENYYLYKILSIKFYFTDGIKYLADQAGAYWLAHSIFCCQLEKEVRKEPFQVWKLIKDNEGNGATLSCDDGNGNIIYMQEIMFTDFPLKEIKLYFQNGVLFLPSEY